MKTFLYSTIMFLLLSLPVAGQQNPLDLIPETAVAVIRIQAPDKVREDLAAFVNKVQPGFGGLIESQFNVALGGAINNPTLDGVDLSKDWFVAIVIDEEQEPQAVLLIPTIDIDAAREAMESRFEIAENEGWILCTIDTASLEDFGNQEINSIAKTFDDKVTQVLMSGHIGIVLNGEKLKDEFADELEEADEQLADAMEQMARQLQNTNPGMDTEMVVAVYTELGELLLQAVRDSESAAWSLEFKEDTFQADMLLTMGADTGSAEFLKTQPVSSLERLNSVPEGLLAYAAVHGDPKFGLDLSARFGQMLASEEQKKKAAQSLDLMRKVKFGTIAGGGQLVPDEENSMRYFAISEMNPATSIRDALKLMGDGIEFEAAGIRQTQTYLPDAETLDGQSLDIFRMKQELPDGMDPTGMQKALNEKFYGPEGMEQRILIQDGLVLQTMGGGMESMKTLLKAKPWTDETLLQARARQHEKANLVVLVDVPNGIYQLAQTMISTNVLPLPVSLEQLEGLELQATYSGFSMAADENRLSARACMPIETFQGFVQISMFVQQMMNAR